VRRNPVVIANRPPARAADCAPYQDRGKGAVEQSQKNEDGNTSMNGQLGHGDEGIELKNADSDLSGDYLPASRPTASRTSVANPVRKLGIPTLDRGVVVDFVTSFVATAPKSAISYSLESGKPPDLKDI
jgi:hypothetical protein